MKKIVVPALLALSIYQPALALDMSTGQFYLSADAGNTDLGSGSAPFSWSFPNENFSYAFRVGYRIPLNNPMRIGLETGYLHLGSYEIDQYYNGNLFFSQYIKQQGVDLLAVLDYQFANGFSLFGKAGGAYIHQDNYFVGNKVSDISAVKPELAAGLGYQISNHVAVTGTLSHIFGSDNMTSSNNSMDYNLMNSTTASIGLRINF